jgi:RimJ/RimL family protein N-acetyltransferase
MTAIRQATAADGLALLALRTRLDHETTFMMLEPGERTTTAEEETERLRGAAEQGNPLVLVAEADGQLVGYLSLEFGQYRRVRHSGYIVVGILQAYTGRGIGTGLFQLMEARAREAGLHRLELTVMTHNQAGVALYRKMGFQIEGTKRHSLQVNGTYVDEHYMAKLLD